MIRFLLFSVFLILGYQFPALAQEPQMSTQMEAITTIPHMIRLSGLWISAGVIFFAWLILRFGGQYGDITAIGLRSVKLRNLDDSIVTIPNNTWLDPRDVKTHTQIA